MNFRFFSSLPRAVWLAAFVLVLPGLAHAQTESSPLPLVSPTTGTIFSNMGELGLSSVRSAAQAQINATPFYKSFTLETRWYDGYFRAAANTTQLALLSDDGTSVWIDGQQVLNRAGRGQGFEAFDSTFVTLTPPSGSFVAGQIYHLRLQYTNVVHLSDGDVDGISLWAFAGGGEIVFPAIDVDMDVDNTTMGGYPNPTNRDRSEAEEAAEAIH